MRIRLVLFKKGGIPRLIIQRIANSEPLQDRQIVFQPSENPKKEGILEKANRIHDRIKQELSHK